VAAIRRIVGNPPWPSDVGPLCHLTFLRPAAMLPDVVVIGVYCGSLGSARILERQGKFKCVFLPIFRALIFAVAGVHVRDSLCQCICESGSLRAAFLGRHGRNYNRR